MDTSREPQPLAYSVDEALEVLRFMSKSGLYRAMGDGSLRWRRHGNRRVILAEDLESFLEGLPVGEPAA